jgi:hypothetical protein
MLLFLVLLLSHCSSYNDSSHCFSNDVPLTLALFSRCCSLCVILLIVLPFLVHCHSSCVAILPMLLLFALLLLCYTFYTTPLTQFLSCYNFHATLPTLFFSCYSSRIVPLALLFLCCNSSLIVVPLALLLFSHYFFRPATPLMLLLPSHYSFSIVAHFRYPLG